MSIVSRPATQAYRDNFDATFGAKEDQTTPKAEHVLNEHSCRACVGLGYGPDRVPCEACGGTGLDAC